MERLTRPQSLAEWNERGQDYLPGHLGIECLAVEPDEVDVTTAEERSEAPAKKAPAKKAAKATKKAAEEETE